MMVDKHLKELALNNRRVIIPDLGAFLSKEGDGDEKNLIFSSFLKYNDGFLEKQLVEKENITRVQAAEEIKKFVDRVTETLRSKQNYALADFGFFHMDERGSIAFSPQEAEEAAEAPKEKPATAAVIAPATTPEEPKKEEEKKVEKEEVKVAAEAKPIVPAATVSSEPAKAEQPKAEKAKQETPKAQPAATSQTPATPPPPSKPTQVKQEPNSQPKSNNNGLLITIIVLLLLIVILLMLYFMVPSVKEKVNSMFGCGTATEQVVTTPEEPKVADSTLTVDSTKLIDTTTPEEVVVPKATSTYGSNYYVIVGTFQDEANAEKMYKRCVADGYKAELLPKMGPLYPVSIFNSPSKTECTKMMVEAKQKYGDAWVFKSRQR